MNNIAKNIQNSWLKKMTSKWFRTCKTRKCKSNFLSWRYIYGLYRAELHLAFRLKNTFTYKFVFIFFLFYSIENFKPKVWKMLVICKETFSYIETYDSFGINYYLPSNAPESFSAFVNKHLQCIIMVHVSINKNCNFS